jgi:hypothetical protein
MPRIGGCLALLILLLSACGAPLSMQERGPTRSVVTGSQRILYDFFQADGWELFALEDDLAAFTVVNGELEARVAADRGYIHARNGVVHRDVIVNAAVRQTEGTLGSAFGVICRADALGNGYYFLLSGDGEFTISVGTLARPELFQLVPWQYHSAINQSFESNTIRAVCAGSYLALFINDVFVAEAFDDEFTEGQLAVTIGATDLPAAARFDNILVRDAILRGAR